MKQLFIATLNTVLILLLAACSKDESKEVSDSFHNSNMLQSEIKLNQKGDESGEMLTNSEKRAVQILTEEKYEILFELNDSVAANAFYEQLPLVVSIEDYAGMEKIFYPTKKLDISNTPLSEGTAGTICYYAPWGNIAMFYKNGNTATGLYEIGKVISGEEFLSNLKGNIQISFVSDGLE